MRPALLAATVSIAALTCTAQQAPVGYTDTPMLPAAQARTGDFELRFWVADYFKTPDTFADIVPVRFTIADAAQHYHVPLLCSPWSFGTYRGS